MTESFGAGAAASGRVRLNIGEVLDRLRPDFPGVTIPKIRFLEDKGLVKPERTPSGYRKFSTDDIERLRYVLRMQRDHYLPLRVIGEHLDAIDRGLAPPPIEPVVPTVPTVALAADGLPSAESFGRRDHVRLSRKELLKIAEISEDLLAQLEQFGLVTPRTGTGHFDTDALVIATDRSRAGGVRLRAATPAGVQDVRGPRGRARRAGGGPPQARSRHRRPGTRRGDRERDRRPLRAPARDPRQGRSPRHLTARPTGAGARACRG